MFSVLNYVQAFGCTLIISLVSHNSMMMPNKTSKNKKAKRKTKTPVVFN